MRKLLTLFIVLAALTFAPLHIGGTAIQVGIGLESIGRHRSAAQCTKVDAAGKPDRREPDQQQRRDAPAPD